MHDNSLAAYKTEEKTLSKRAWDIYRWLAAHGPATDRQVATGMQFPDMNCVRPRITELLAAGWAVEIGTTQCPITRKTVRLVKTVDHLEQQTLSL
jgi:hypothetical protein